MFLAIVPAYNEEDSIGSVVRDLFHHVDEVVVVNDGSRDETVREATDAGATVLSHEINRGQGAALETGHEYARRAGATHALHFDGDGQFCVEDIAAAKAKLEQSNADILFGSRFLDNRSELPWLKKYLLLPLGRLVNRLFGAPKLSDAHNGFRILGPRAIESIRITHDDMAHATEIPILASHAGLTIVEHPVKVQYREFGQGPVGGLRIVRDLFLGSFVK